MRCVGRIGERRIGLAGVGGPCPGDRSGSGKQVIERVARPGAQELEDPPAYRRGLGPDHPAPQRIQRFGPAHQRIDPARPGGQLAAVVIDDWFPGVQRPPTAGRPFAPVPGGHPDTSRAQRENGRQRLRRAAQGPSVIGGQAVDERGVVDLAAIVRVMR